MRKIGLTIAASVWVLIVAGLYVLVPVWCGWSGERTGNGPSATGAWYGLAWVLAVVIAAVPFCVYSSIEER